MAEKRPAKRASKSAAKSAAKTESDETPESTGPPATRSEKATRGKTREVRMRRRMSGNRDGVRWPAPGDTIVVPEAEADSLVRTGAATELDE